MALGVTVRLVLRLSVVSRVLRTRPRDCSLRVVLVMKPVETWRCSATVLTLTERLLAEMGDGYQYRVFRAGQSDTPRMSVADGFVSGIEGKKRVDHFAKQLVAAIHQQLFAGDS